MELSSIQMWDVENTATGLLRTYESAYAGRNFFEWLGEWYADQVRQGEMLEKKVPSQGKIKRLARWKIFLSLVMEAAIAKKKKKAWHLENYRRIFNVLLLGISIGDYPWEDFKKHFGGYMAARRRHPPLSIGQQIIHPIRSFKENVAMAKLKCQICEKYKIPPEKLEDFDTLYEEFERQEELKEEKIEEIAALQKKKDEKKGGGGSVKRGKEKSVEKIIAEEGKEPIIQEETEKEEIVNEEPIKGIDAPTELKEEILSEEEMKELLKEGFESFSINDVEEPAKENNPPEIDIQPILPRK